MYSILALVSLFLAIPAAAQTLKLQNPGTGSVTLDKDWRLHLGDDTQWADPALDDSKLGANPGR
jgi:hypothetical protein